MYASTTVTHIEMPDPINVAPYATSGIGVHLPDVYLSFSADEAERLGLTLVKAAALRREHDAQAEKQKEAA